MKKIFERIFAPIRGLLEFIQRYFKALLFLLILLLLFWPGSAQELASPNLMQVKLEGPIITAEEVLKQLEEAEERAIRGVLFVVDSPGGAVAPSIEISMALQRLREKKPVIAYAAGTMASGSYYASIHADEIVANPGSLIGSIGVIFEGANLEELASRIGVAPQIVQAGRYKQVGTPFRKWKPYERAELERVIHDTYGMFVSDVAAARGLDRNRSASFADAHIFTAREAKRVGLIDKVGSIADAKKDLIAKSGVQHPRWKRKSRFDTLLDRLFDEASTKLLGVFTGLKAY